LNVSISSGWHRTAVAKTCRSPGWLVIRSGSGDVYVNHQSPYTRRQRHSVLADSVPGATTANKPPPHPIPAFSGRSFRPQAPDSPIAPFIPFPEAPFPAPYTWDNAPRTSETLLAPRGRQNRVASRREPVDNQPRAARPWNTAPFGRVTSNTAPLTATIAAMPVLPTRRRHLTARSRTPRFDSRKPLIPRLTPLTPRGYAMFRPPWPAGHYSLKHCRGGLGLQHKPPSRTRTASRTHGVVASGAGSKPRASVGPSAPPSRLLYVLAPESARESYWLTGLSSDILQQREVS
jgi:hypothetical protein